MQHHKTLLYLCITISVINLFAILFYSRVSGGSRSVTAASYEGFPEEWQQTVDVAVPAEISFAGEAVPLRRRDVQEALRRELIVNTYLHSHSIQIMKHAPRIFARIEPLLKEHGIPDDFKYLAVIESNLNPLAVSPSGATGIWQFMPETAKEFGLEIDSEVDERFNIEKATVAAAGYLKKSYERFGSWTTAAAAYNAGGNMVQKQMEIQKEEKYYDLLLGEETERYLFRILAMKQILTHPRLYNFDTPEAYPVEKIEIVEVSGPVNDLADFAQKQGISYKTLKRFNPWLRKPKLRNASHKTYHILIPAEKEYYR
ncbi:MAG: lytic transglycosylase domain-containing protein [Culturomica sp.]|nr:lytic transglycosylase domain-containing protein [Culturomica sp.]